MDRTRRAFLIDTGKFVLLTGAASIAWDHVLAGAPASAPNYTTADRWWAMIIDVEKCIGCGTCVRACKTENHVPLEPGCSRTWVERYQVDPADIEHPVVDSPDGAAPLGALVDVGDVVEPGVSMTKRSIWMFLESRGISFTFASKDFIERKSFSLYPGGLPR